jgi:pyruvate,orthophosphate dikinase
VVARGVAACPGVASGVAVDDSDAACEADGDVILTRPTTSPEDVSGMIAARAVVTERGGSTSHAAVVTRALGRPSVVGVGEGTTAELAGSELTVDGSAGVVYRGILPTEEVDPASVPGLETLIGWARELSPVEVVVADGPGSVDPESLGTSDDVSTAAGARAAIRAGVERVQMLPGQHEAALLLRFAQEKWNLEHEEESS